MITCYFFVHWKIRVYIHEFAKRFVHVSVSIYLFICLSHESTYRKTYIFTKIYKSKRLKIFISLHLYIYISVFLYIFISTYLYIWISIFLFIYISMYLHVHISIYVEIFVSIDLCTYISIHRFMFTSLNLDISWYLYILTSFLSMSLYQYQSLNSKKIMHDYTHLVICFCIYLHLLNSTYLDFTCMYFCTY